MRQVETSVFPAKMTTAMKGRDYELVTRGIFQQLLNQESIPNILVEHDCVKQGIKTKHQIDVYWEFKLGGITYRNVVQAKNWAKRVDKSAVLKLEAVLRDLPGQPRGIIVTAQGYQKGALEVANSCGIKIYVLQQEAPPPHIVLNYTGWMRYAIKGYKKTASGEPLGLVVETELVNPEFSNLLFQADPASVRDNGATLAAMSQLQVLPHELELYDAEPRFLRTLRDIYVDFAKEIHGRGETNARQTYSFDSPTFLKLPSTSSVVKITSLSVEVTLKIEHQERLWKCENVVMFILKDLEDGKTLQIAQVRQN